MKLKAMRDQISAGDSTYIAAADALEDDLNQSRRKAYTLHETLEEEAFNTGKKHDVCSTTPS